MIIYHIVNIRTGATVASYKNRNAARNRRDKLDIAYGAISYTIKTVEI